MHTSCPSTVSDTSQLKERAQNWTILLDLDGTLGYSLIPQSQAEKKALQFIVEWQNKQCFQSKNPLNLNLEQLRQQYQQIKKQLYREFVAHPQRHNKRLRFQRLLRELCQVQKIECSETFLDQLMGRYWETFEKEANVFKDTYESVQRLRKDFLLIILTNNLMDEALKKLQVFGLEQGIHFDLLITAECIGYCKDAEGFFEHLKEYMNRYFEITLIPDRLVVVGDDLSDIEFGNKAGLISVRIKQDLLGEKDPKHKLEEPNFTINTLSELIPIMKNHLASQRC